MTAPTIMQMVISSHANYYQTAKRKIKKHCVPQTLFWSPILFSDRKEKMNPGSQLVREMQRVSAQSLR